MENKALAACVLWTLGVGSAAAQSYRPIPVPETLVPEEALERLPDLEQKIQAPAALSFVSPSRDEREEAPTLSTIFDGERGTRAAPESVEAPEPWPTLERAALRAAGAAPEFRAGPFRDQAIAKMRGAPDAGLGEILASSLSAVHRLDAAQTAKARDLFDERPIAPPLPIRAKRLIEAGDELLLASEDSLYRLLRPEKHDELAPIWKVRDVVDFGGRRYAATGKGISILLGRTARAAGGAAHGAPLHDLAVLQGALFASAKGAIYRLDEEVLRSVAAPTDGEIYHLVEAGGRIYASTSKGVFLGRIASAKETRERLEKSDERPNVWDRLFGKREKFRKKTVQVDAPVIAWETEPIFRENVQREEVDDYYGTKSVVTHAVQAYQVEELGGRLHIATDSGLYIQDGRDWRNALPGLSIHRLKKTDSGTYALTDKGVYRQDSRGWSRAFPTVDLAYDLAERDGLVYLAADDLRVFQSLPESWQEAVLRSISSAAQEPATPLSSQLPGLREEDQTLLGRSGRAIFGPSK